MSLAEDIKILREKTGAGLMDCKKALIECKDDMEQAIVFLRKKGLADMAKRSDRETKEGRVSVKTDGKNFAMIYLGCETDFVAKTDAFIKLADDLAQWLTMSTPTIKKPPCWKCPLPALAAMPPKYKKLPAASRCTP